MQRHADYTHILSGPTHASVCIYISAFTCLCLTIFTSLLRCRLCVFTSLCSVACRNMLSINHIHPWCVHHCLHHSMDKLTNITFLPLYVAAYLLFPIKYSFPKHDWLAAPSPASACTQCMFVIPVPEHQITAIHHTILPLHAAICQVQPVVWDPLTHLIRFFQCVTLIFLKHNLYLYIWTCVGHSAI